jgi:hypothetical protein
MMYIGWDICCGVLYFDGMYVAGNKYFVVYIDAMYWMGYMLLNCCRLFLNELPISPEMSIYFRFG